MLSRSLRLCFVFLLLLQVSYGQDDRDMMIPTSFDEIPEYQREHLNESRFSEGFVAYKLSIASASKQSNGTLALNATEESLSFLLKIYPMVKDVSFSESDFKMVIGNSIAEIHYTVATENTFVKMNSILIGDVNKTDPFLRIEISRDGTVASNKSNNTATVDPFEDICNEQEQCKLNYTINWEDSTVNTELWIPVSEFLVDVPPPTTTTAAENTTTPESNISMTTTSAEAPQPDSSIGTTTGPNVGDAGTGSQGLKWGIGLTLFVILYAAVAAIAIFYYRHQKKELERETSQSLQTPSTVPPQSTIQSEATTLQQPSSTAATKVQSKSKNTQKSSGTAAGAQQKTKKVLRYTPDTGGAKADKVNLPPSSSKS